MVAPAKGPYESITKWGESAQAEKPDGGIGKVPEKGQTPTLRIFGSNLGNQWLTYGTIGGGTQDYVASPIGSNTPAQCKWFRFCYTGIMEIGKDSVFGNWKVTVEGEGLDQVAYEVGKHVKPTMFVGEKTTGLLSVTIKSITIAPNEIKKLKGSDEQEDWEGAVAGC